MRNQGTSMDATSSYSAENAAESLSLFHQQQSLTDSVTEETAILVASEAGINLVGDDHASWRASELPASETTESMKLKSLQFP